MLSLELGEQAMILIVDDDPAFLGRATEVLTSKTEQVLCAPNTRQALNLVNNIVSEIELALVDLDLGDSNGFDFIMSLQKLDVDLPVIAISGVFSDAALESSRVMGAKGILRKPIDDHWRDEINRLRRRKSRSRAQ
jgi:two-component system cell cycle sensor histidine kinase/response regulator CckA